VPTYTHKELTEAHNAYRGTKELPRTHRSPQGGSEKLAENHKGSQNTELVAAAEPLSKA